GGVWGGDAPEGGAPPLLPGAGGSLPPGVVAGGRDAQRVAQEAHGPLVAVLFDEAKGHITSRAKSAVAFFRMAHSARRRLFSARRRRSSSSMAGGLPWPGKAWSPGVSRAGLQERRGGAWMLRARAPLSTEDDCSG